MIQHQNTIKPNETPILFVNFSDDPYEIKWDGQVQATLKPKETTWLPYWLAEHAAKHLVDREMNKKEIPTDHHSRESYVAKCIGNKPGEQNDDPLGLKVLNKNMEAAPATPKKASTPKKAAKATSDEDTFQGK